MDVPRPTINYPVINVPTQEEYDAAVKADREKEQQQQQEKSRGLPDTTPPPPPVPPAINQVSANVSTPIIEVPSKPETPTITVGGVNINLPDPSIVATAGAVAVVTTAVTVASTAAFNILKNAAEPFLKEAVKNKFKVKIKQVKPVLHYVLADNGHIDVLEYSDTGTKMVAQIDDVEKYIRDQIEINTLYEIENKIIIDDVIKDKFTKEGQARFKSLYTPAKKIAKKLAARLSF